MISRRSTAWVAGVVLALASTAAAEDPADVVEAVQEEFREAKRARSLGIDKCLGWIGRLYEVADARPGSEEGFEALGLVLDISGSRKSSEIQRAAEPALGRIVDGYSDDLEKIGPFLRAFAGDRELVERVLAKTTSPAVRATVAHIEIERIVDLGYVDPIPDGERERALELCRRMETEYVGVKDANGTLFTELVAGDRFQLENLNIGMVAPDIVAADLDGVEFKLSDYRGKVVVLDFWGNW